MPINTSQTVSFRTNGYIAKKLLETFQAQVVTERFGQIDSIPNRSTRTIRFRVYDNFDSTPAPLAEGVPPVGKSVTFRDITATLRQYGDVVKLTDVLVDSHEDPIVKRTAKLLGEQAVQMIEKSRIEILKAGSNVFLASGVATRTLVNAALTRGDLRKVSRQLHRNNAKKITEIISATAKVGTQPVEAAFFAMGHTDLLSDIRGISGFIPVAQYSNDEKGLPGEVGRIEDFRFILTTNFTPWLAAGASGTTYLSNGAAVTGAAACDVYPIIVVAQDAYGIVPMQGSEAVDVGIQNPGVKTKDDPCGQQGFASWITSNTACILNESYMARIEVACTANPT